MELGHLYRETAHWGDSIAFWKQLGFLLADQWGSEPHRAGRLTNGSTSLVLAESLKNPTESVFVSVDDLDSIAEAAGEPVVDTHWGTRMVSVTDPDGRTYNFEPRSQES